MNRLIHSLFHHPQRNRYQKELYQKHVSRVKNMMPFIDSHFSTPILRRSNVWKERLRIKHKIEQENVHLLFQIAQVVQRSRIDNMLSEHVNNVRKFKRELSALKKKRMLEKINHENIYLINHILKIKKCHPFLRNKK
jgi:hypothetical protein